MSTVGIYDQYTTIAPLFRGMPTWLSGSDQRRLASYDTYEQIYWNVPEAFKLIHRGDDSKPIYIPSGKQIVETLHRFLANDMEVVADTSFGTDGEREEAGAFLVDLLRRERFYSKFTANKRFGIIRGDWFWHLLADPERTEGSRISVMPVDPSSVFPVYNEENIDEIIGYHIVEQYTDNAGKTKIRRLSYMKETEQGGPSPILMSDAIMELDAWGQPGTDMEEKFVQMLEQDVRLPDPIDSLPIYHIQNFQEPGNPWGSSELRGMERIIAAVNQSVSDEELSLALEGLGVYKTSSGPPTDDDGNELPWNLGPARVVEIDPEADFDRVEGVRSLLPFQEHLKYLHDQLNLGSGTPAVAIGGDVDVQLAESGVALMIKMGPLLARAGEKENIITDVSGNMFYDLRKFAIAYEPSVRGPMEACRFGMVYGDKIPQNKKQKFDQLMKMASLDPPLVSRAWIREQLYELGFDIPEDDEAHMNTIIEEQTVFGQLAADAEGARLDRELEDETDDGSGGAA